MSAVHLAEPSRPIRGRARIWGTRVARLLIAAVLVATVLTGISTPSPANALVVGVCTIKANDPHASSHVSGTINTTGTVSCSIIMDEIYLAVWLEKANGSSWSSFPFYDSYNTKYASENSSTSCSQGPATFRTRVAYVLRAPAGYDPAYATSNIYSPWKSVACGVGLTSGGQSTSFEIDVPIVAS